MKLSSWLKILSRLMKPGIATQKYKQMKSASLNFHVSASTALIHDYHKTLLDIINCQKLEFRSDWGVYSSIGLQNRAEISSGKG